MGTCHDGHTIIWWHAHIAHIMRWWNTDVFILLHGEMATCMVTWSHSHMVFKIAFTIAFLF